MRIHPKGLTFAPGGAFRTLPTATSAFYHPLFHARKAQLSHAARIASLASVRDKYRAMRI